MDKPQFTITLGRTGQVVNRGRNMPNEAFLDPGSQLSATRKRLGSDADKLVLSRNKRQREDGIKWNWGENGDFQIGKYDLRMKLLRKSLSKQSVNVVRNHKRMDPRETISRTIKPPARLNMLRNRHESNSRNILRQGHQKQNETYASLDEETLRGLPPKQFHKQQQYASMTAAVVTRDQRGFSNDAHDDSKLTRSTNFKMKANPETPRPVKLLTSTSGSMQKTTSMGEEHPTVASFLSSLGLEKYSVTFQAEEVDMTVLKQMGDKDLKELGMPMGPRKKILLSLQPRPRRPPP